MKKFVLMPARHNHPEIDGLPSIFKDTKDVFNLECTESFKGFISSILDNEEYTELKVYVTGLTPAYDALIKILHRSDLLDEYIKLSSYHYDRDNNNYRMIEVGDL